MKTSLFRETITCLADWGRVFQSREVFTPMIDAILARHDLERAPIENCTPGSNAVFKVGRYILKIFAPEESEIGGERDYLAERFGIARANALGVPAPKLYASGEFDDKYTFRYLVLEYFEGRSLADISDDLGDAERRAIGRQLRAAVKLMDTPCERFNDHELFSEFHERKWEVFPERFRAERKRYLEAHAPSLFVFCHGDLNPDNIIVGDDLEIRIIDFADALLAPPELELAATICGAFNFDRAYVDGFLGEYDRAEVVERLLYGLLLHDYGANIIREDVGKPSEIVSLNVLRERLTERL